MKYVISEETEDEFGLFCETGENVVEIWNYEEESYLLSIDNIPTFIEKLEKKEYNIVHDWGEEEIIEIKGDGENVVYVLPREVEDLVDTLKYIYGRKE